MHTSALETGNQDTAPRITHGIFDFTVPGWFVDWMGHKNNSSEYPEDSDEGDIWSLDGRSS